MPRNVSKGLRYVHVADALRTEILRGDRLPGDRLPKEEELARRFDTTRTTVRKGIHLLKTEGLVESQQGKGAFVRKRPRVNMIQIGSIYRKRRETGVSNFNAEAEAQGLAANQVLKEVAEVPAPDDIATRLGLPPGAPVVLRRRLFTIEGEPAQLVDGYYDPSLVAGTKIAQPRKIRGGVHAVIEDPEGPIKRRIVRFIEDLDVRMPHPHESEQLKIGTGVPIARVLKTAYDSSGKVLEVLDSRIPCDRHSFRYSIDV